MTDIIIKSGDTPSKLAAFYVKDANKWPEFCAANPQFKKHSTYGCEFFAGQTAHLPPSWASGSPAAPIPGPVPQPVGPPVNTSTDTAPPPAESSSLIFGLDAKKATIGAVVIAAGIVAVYAFKKKPRTAAA